jgi:hypothetical protein
MKPILSSIDSMPRVAWKSFTDGRALARGLELKCQRGWWEWSKSGQRPSDIPSNPQQAYRDDGWISWADWLGNEGRVLAKDMLPFTVGRALARGLGLEGNPEWRKWSKSEQRPSDIPSSPDQPYRADGWVSWPDWLGSEGRVYTKKEVLPFTEGRAFARGLGLKSKKGWEVWSKSGQRPTDIPAHPETTYRDDGWISYPDWLGYGEGRVSAKDMLPFAVGRAYARKLELRSWKEWAEWSKSGQRPSNIPANPHKVYRDDGWISYPDWLGFVGRAPPGSMLPFAVGRAYVRKLKLENVKEWCAWSKSGQRPSNIPANPHKVYRDDGWISMPDWLGYGSAGGAAASRRASSSSSSATTAPKKKTKKKKRKRRPNSTHPSDLPPPPPPSTSPFKSNIKTEPASSKSSGGSSDRSTEPPLRKIKKEEDA